MEPRRGLMPPVYVLLTIVVMYLLQEFLPVLGLGTPLRYAGGVLLVLGFAITVASARRFSKLGTPVRPFEASTVVVTTGMFQYTRNPMYLGMVVALLGLAGILGDAVAVAPIPFFAAVLHYRFVLREERFMKNLFGDEYLAYKQRVRRWI